MGAWGCGSFENDDALDWLCELGEAGDLSAIESALGVVANASGYLEAPECSAALAAAEVIAVLDGRPGKDLPEGVYTFARGRPRPSPDHVSVAKTAVRRVVQESELLDLWRESDELESWQAGIADLQRRLDSAG